MDVPVWVCMGWMMFRKKGVLVGLHVISEMRQFPVGL